MSNDFNNRFQLYIEGKLNEAEAASMEEEIEKYRVIKDYLEDTDEEFIEKLKKEMDSVTPREESTIGKNVNKKMIKKIASISFATILVCLIILPMLYLSVSSLLGKAFRVDSNRFVQERSFTGQFISMVSPKIITTGGSDHTEFYKQNFTSSYVKGISRKSSENKIEVNYSFGKLEKPISTIDKPLELLYADQFYAMNSQNCINSRDWEYLEKAPKGTKAQIFITFKSKLSPQQAVEALGKEYVDVQKNFNTIMLADIDSKIVVANMNPAYYYNKNNGSSLKQEELNYISKFNSYDNDIQRQVLLFELSEIKKNKNLVDYITVNYSRNGRELFQNIDRSISYVEKNGVQYVGAFITGDTEELLKLRDNPNIFSCSVEDIVIW